MAKVTIGTVSAGTLRTEDLLNTFSSELAHLARYEPQNQAHLRLAFEADTSFQDFDESDTKQVEQAEESITELMDALNEYCPPFVYFGTHPGDGADFGFWPDMDALHEAMYYTKHIVGVEHPPSDVGEHTFEDMGVIIQISDHGNIRVMDMDRNELWSVV